MISSHQAIAESAIYARPPGARESGLVVVPAPVVVPIYATPRQLDFLTDTETFMLAAIGGIGSGKTHVLMSWAGSKMYLERGTGTVGGIFANTYLQLEQATLPKLWVFLEMMGLKRDIDFVYNKRPPYAWRGFRSRFEKHNGILSIRRWGQVIIRSLDNPEGIRGIELGWAAIDEMRGTKLDTFNVVLGRVRCPLARLRMVRAATSPNGYDWIHDEMVDKAHKMPAGKKRRVIHMRTIDNPFLDPDYYEMLLASYDPKYAEQELEGKFISLTSGAVFHQFDRTVHVKKSLPVDPSLDAIVSFDFNRNPFCAVIIQCAVNGPSPQVRVVDEVRIEGSGTDRMCAEVIDRLKKHGINKRSVLVYGDPSGSHRQTTSNLSDYDVIEQEFQAAFGNRFERMWARAAKPVMEGVNAINAMLRNSKGEVRLYLHERCEHTRKDLERVVFSPGSKQIDKKDKNLTHLSDALRYYIDEEHPVGRAGVARIHT